ncbi:hypothetical protein N7494_000871 [Penicillium frequentans]|uniref:Uncharacterized protein n=1 Tax=Penicillium frequentans TaxID=3151616 RepID=A0AAD6D6X3_9EURO|nr:hypothetical protein N7494_000871 [Penicillium glabrum]
MAVFSVGEADINGFVCLAPVERKTNPSNYCRLLRVLILLYIDQGGFRTGYPFGSGNIGRPTPQIPTIFSSDREIALKDILVARFLWTADFKVVCMTRNGNVLFNKLYNRLWFAIDQSGLETGRLTALEFQPKHSVLWRAFNLGQVMIFYYGQGYTLDALIDEHIGGPPWVNEPYAPSLYPRS